jgi:hypothetical protein
MKKAETCLWSVVAGNRITDHKCNYYINTMRLTGTKTTIKNELP